MVTKYAISAASVSKGTSSHVILLTGTTENLRAHLLAQIADLDSVNGIICLLRCQVPSSEHPSDSLINRQLDALEGRRNSNDRETLVESPIAPMIHCSRLPWLGRC